MERVLAGIAGPAGAIGGACAEDVIVGKDVVVTEALDDLGLVAQRHRIGADFCLRKDRSEFHR